MMSGIKNRGNPAIQFQASSGTGGPANSPRILYQRGVPTVLLSSATNITATGAITGLTALPYVPSGVVFVYCFAQTGLLEGLYYARFSSTTACQLYTDVDGTITPNGITAGAYVGGTAEVILASLIIPGGSMGANGMISAQSSWGCSNSANTKSARTRLNGVLFGQQSQTTMASFSMMNGIKNRGNPAIQFQPASGTGAPSIALGGSPSSSNVNAQTTIDTAVDTTLTFRGKLDVATDFLVLETCTIEILAGT